MESFIMYRYQLEHVPKSCQLAHISSSCCWFFGQIQVHSIRLVIQLTWQTLLVMKRCKCRLGYDAVTWFCNCNGIACESHVMNFGLVYQASSLSVHFISPQALLRRLSYLTNFIAFFKQHLTWSIWRLPYTKKRIYIQNFTDSFILFLDSNF